MAYIDVISLSSAKNYLGVDDTSRDAEITRIISASLAYLERYTNVFLYARDKEYIYTNYCVRVFDFPINTTILPINTTNIKYALSNFYSDNEAESITLNVGYTNVSDIPYDLVEVGYNIIEHLYEGKKLTELPEMIVNIMDNYKRFIV